MGVAGASPNGHFILFSGMAGLLAGAFSMALGEWVSVTSSRELATREINIERDELTFSPEEEREELQLIYEAKGLTSDMAEKLSKRLVDDPSNALDVLTREELGLDPQELGGSARVAALTSFLLFALGAIIPVAPFLFFMDRLVFLPVLERAASYSLVLERRSRFSPGGRSGSQVSGSCSSGSLLRVSRSHSAVHLALRSVEPEIFSYVGY